MQPGMVESVLRSSRQGSPDKAHTPSLEMLALRMDDTLESVERLTERLESAIGRLAALDSDLQRNPGSPSPTPHARYSYELKVNHQVERLVEVAKRQAWIAEHLEQLI